MGKVLRVMNGPHEGSVFVLRSRTVIGRAGHADIQLVNETVSRQHAKIVVDPGGEVTLTDLASDNGTYVNGEAIRRCVLEVGDMIAVAGTRFVFEDHSAAAGTSNVFAAKVTSSASLRQTAPHKVVRHPGASPAGVPARGEYGSRDRQRERVRPAAAAAAFEEDALLDPRLAEDIDLGRLDAVGPPRETSTADPRPRRSAARARRDEVPMPAPGSQRRPARPVMPPRAAAGWPARAAPLSGAPRDPNALVQEPALAVPAERLHGERVSREAAVGLGPEAAPVLPPDPFPSPTPAQEAKLGVPADVTHPDAPPPDHPAPMMRGWPPRPAAAPRRDKRKTSEYPQPAAPVATEAPTQTPPPSSARRRRSTAEYGSEPAFGAADDELDADVLPAPADVVGLDVFLDVVEYRELRIRMLRGPSLDAHERATFRALERRLERAPEHGDEASLQRRFHRFECALRAAIHVGSPRGPRIDARVIDLSAGGAQVVLAGARVEPGDTVWLAVDLVAPRVPDSVGPDPDPVVLECRVVWGSPRGARLGVIFAGRPRVQTS